MTSFLAGPVLIAAGDEAFVERVHDALSPARAQLPSADVAQTATVATRAALVDRACRERAQALLVDYRWGLRDMTPAVDPKTLTLQRIGELLNDEAATPPALSLLSELASRARKQRGAWQPVAMLFADGPGVAFVQVSLKLGADWVWTSRSRLDRLEEVLTRLVELQGTPADERPRPRVLVVENGPADMATIETRLDGLADLVFVGAEEYSAREITITPDLVVRYFDEHGPFDAAIVDLALSRAAEDVAREQYGSEDAAIDTFLREGLEDLLRNFTGVDVLERLLQKGPRLPIFVMSNWTGSATLLSQILQKIRLALGEAGHRLKIFDKTEASYRALRGEIASLSCAP